MAYIYLKNENDALDVVQEVAYRSFKHIETLKKPEYFKTWLIKLTITCSISLIKKNKKIIQLPSEYDKFFILKDEDISLSVTLQELLNALHEDEKSIIILKFYEGYTFKEIADLLSMPLGSVKSVLYRALGKLRKQFKGAGLGE